MKKEFPYKPNDIVTIYSDWENEKNPIGTAKLVRLHKQGRTFILEDMYPEDTQIVYNWQEWVVDFLPMILDTGDVILPHYSVEKIRYIDTIGIANSADDDWEPGEYEKLDKDKFLSFNGKEIY